MVVMLLPDLKMPQSCSECQQLGCYLPTLQYRPHELSQQFLHKRHPLCPLREIDQEFNGKGVSRCIPK